jgi:hypothetical protein
VIYTRAHINALESQIADLKERLEKADRERQSLLDRLLEKHNVMPIIPPAPQPAAIEVIHPYGVLTPDVDDAVRESWLQEEMQHIRMTQGIEDPERLRALAIDSYIVFHQAIK